MTTVLDPTGGVTRAVTRLVDRPASLRGLVVGYLDNGKPNSDRLLALLAERFAGEEPAGVVRVRKGGVGRLAEPEIVADLAERCDVVVTGVGDCAGCCSCTVQDGVALERLGVPTYVIATSSMVTTATIAATSAGVPDYPFIVIDHPLGSLTEDVLAQRAAYAHQRILDSR